MFPWLLTISKKEHLLTYFVVSDWLRSLAATNLDDQTHSVLPASEEPHVSKYTNKGTTQ